MANYFDKFPTVAYNGNVVRNILAKVDFTRQTKKDIYSNFDFVLQEGSSRADLLSNTYYGSPWYTWLIYMQNDIIDPYHDYYKSEDDLMKMIVAKYSSIQAANQIILYYRNDWATSGGGQISTTVYDALTSNTKKYYRPILNINNQILGYKRLEEDWTVSTNKIVELTLSSSAISNLNVGDILTQSATGSKGTITQIDTNTNIVTIQHITGSFQTSNSILSINEGPRDPITGKLLWQIIPDEEATFWAPVTAYEYELETNASKKFISMIKSSYVRDIDRLLTQQITA